MAVRVDRTRSPHPTATSASAGLRRFLLLILFLELIGIGAELLLSAHIADLWQWVPVVLIAAGILLLSWCALDHRLAPIRALQTLMTLFVLSGFLGLLLHFRAKMEFQLEVNPSLGGKSLIWEAARSISPPTLAPGIMIQMGLLGFAYAYRHPALRGSSSAERLGNSLD
jgi:hypothetical protein